MSYNEQLNRLIDKSGLTLNEIAKRCKEYGVDITPQYLTNLKNNANRSSSDDTSIAIAKACGAHCPEILAIESFIDKAPDYMIKFFETYRKNMLEGIVVALQEKLDDKQAILMKERLEQLSIADFIVAMNELADIDMSQMQTKTENNEIRVIAEYTTPFYVVATDDSMSPLLLKEGKAEYSPITAEEISSGDFICYKIKGKKGEYIRKCVVSDDKTVFTMYPINPKYKPKAYKIDEIDIIGKTKQFAFEI